VEVGDVVVRLSYQQRHVVRGTKPSRILVGRERLTEFVQADVADGEIAEDYSESLSIFAALKLTIGALIVLERFREAVLPVKDVANVDVKAGEAPGVLLCAKDLACPIRHGERAIVFAEQA